MVKDHFSVFLEKTIAYYYFFSYAPTLREVWEFFPMKISFKEFKKIVHGYLQASRGIYLRNGRIVSNIGRGIDIGLLEKSNSIAQKKTRQFISLERLFILNPFVAFVGITGSVAADNAKESDDIDIFVISYPHRLWICRLVMIVILSLFGIRRKPSDTDVKDKICCNLWFDGSDITVPREKQSSFVAKEIVLMKPMICRPFKTDEGKSSYLAFIQKNIWLFDYLPNIRHSYFMKKDRKIRHSSVQNQWGALGALSNRIAMQFQKKIMRTPTTEYLSDSQLWFFPRDVSVLLSKKGLS